MGGNPYTGENTAHSNLNPPPRISFSRPSTATSTKSRASNMGLRAKLGRRALGIILLFVTVLLWTISNFLASSIFSDGTYDKPFFLVYVNTSMFAISLIPMSIRYVMRHGWQRVWGEAAGIWQERRRNGLFAPFPQADGYGRVEEGRGPGGAARVGERREFGEDQERLLQGQGEDDDDEGTTTMMAHTEKEEEPKLSFLETSWLSLEFCMLWFLANYFASACLEYTSVASVTILTSTSSIWTLIFCALTRVESFSVRKLLGVLASLAGVILISTVDLSGAADQDRGNFPHKSTVQIAIGDSMAFFSAIIYGVYVTVMKRRVGNEDRVDMPLFFGMVGLFNVVLLWPLFPILHYTGIETLEMPPTGKIWLIIIVNSVASFFSDMTWAYAMLLTTPVVVTVGLSLNIPLSLIGEMIQYAQFSSWIYWVGAGIVFLSFVFVNHESNVEADEALPGIEGVAGSDEIAERRRRSDSIKEPEAALGTEMMGGGKDTGDVVPLVVSSVSSTSSSSAAV